MSSSSKVMNIVGDDYNNDHDLRLARRLKRRCVADAGFKKYSGDTTRQVLADVEMKNKNVGKERRVSWTALGGYSDVLSVKEHSVVDDDIDPQYKIFMAQLRPDGRSYVLEVALDDEMSELIKYEEDEESCPEPKPQSPTKLLNNQSKSFDQTEIPEKGDNVLVGERSLVVAKKVDGLESIEPISCKANESSCKKDGLKGYASKKFDCVLDIGSDSCDKDYLSFLKGLRREGSCLVFMNEDGEQVIYEEEDDGESSSDSDILEIDIAPDSGEKNYTPFVTSRKFEFFVDVDDAQCTGNHWSSVNSQFRENLMVVLRKPYDQREYDELLQEVSLRKPLERDRNLRGRIKSYSLECCSKSYLDHYADLATKVDSFKYDCRKVLNILRGFFFWLKNLSHEGAFRPWLDASCLVVVPST